MKTKKTKQLVFENLEGMPLPDKAIILDKEQFIQALEEIEVVDDIEPFRRKVVALKDVVLYRKDNAGGIANIGANGEAISLRRDVLISEVEQILKSQTLERAKYYLRRLKNGVSQSKTSKINDINLLRWKEYDGILTDSLWVLDKRDTSGAHLAWYWGNFIPQIPHQIMLRYTKKGDWVLDTFVGSGTTLIECKRLGRNGIGVEISPEIAKKAEELIEKEPNGENVATDVVVGDSRTVDIREVLERHGVTSVQLLLLHPPYHDIITFSQNGSDLSNAGNTEEFLKMFGEVVDNVCPYLDRGRYLALVIGDKYSKGEWIPLGFYCMNEVLKRGYTLKSIVVKNFDETRGKRNQKELWRYRAFVGGFYIFKHEYVMLFKKSNKEL
jgi:hypothetical protein